MAKIIKVPESETEWQLQFMCPGCKQEHSIFTQQGRPSAKDGFWSFNENYDKPTLYPSVHVWHFRPDNSKQTDCHSFVEEGMIRFLNDCPHSLKGQTVELPDITI